MDSIVTPEHFYALFYGFGKYTTIKKCSASFHLPSLSIPISHSLSLWLFSHSLDLLPSLAPSLSFVRLLSVCIPIRHRASGIFDYFHLPYYALVFISLSSIRIVCLRIDSRAIVMIANQGVMLSSFY